LEKGFTDDTALADWRQAIVDGKDDRKTGAIVFLNADGSEALRYNFFRAWPVNWEGPALNAGGSDTAIEKIELAVEWIQVEAAAG
jgi:phage tail-like protein